MTEIIFSKDALSFYEDLRSKHYSREKYNSSNSIFHDEIKPKILDLLTQLADMLAFEISELTFDASDDLGSPWVHGHAAKYAWGAITRLEKQKHSDLQFYVALRFDYIRLDSMSVKNMPPVFLARFTERFMEDETRFLSMLNALEKDGTFQRWLSSEIKVQSEVCGICDWTRHHIQRDDCAKRFLRLMFSLCGCLQEAHPDVSFCTWYGKLSTSFSKIGQ